MKTSQNQLKALVKELLIEILQEGLGGRTQAVSQPVIEGRQRVPQGTRRPTFDPRLDTPLVGGRQVTNALRDAVKRESGGSSVLADILADTAITTLPSQLSHGDSMGRPSVGGMSRPSVAQQEQFNGEPAEVFGEAAEMRADGSSHWADLAFMSTKKTA